MKFKPSWINCDCFDLFASIPKKSANLILTSPPYGVGKEYEEKGSNLHFLEKVIKELARIVRDDGVVCWQVGTYIMEDGSLLPLDLVTDPIFREYGFRLQTRIIWNFEHGQHAKTRLSGRYETVMVYVKSKNHYFNLDAIRVPNKQRDKRNKKGNLSSNPRGKNPGDVGRITNVKNAHPEKVPGGHPCQMPLRLALKLIRAYSPHGGVVIDPFGGLATTYISSSILGRIPVSSERVSKYYKLASPRINSQPKVAQSKREISREDIIRFEQTIKAELSFQKKEIRRLDKAPSPLT